MDVYQSDHHGLDQSNNPVLVKTLQPTVVVFNNGPRKGGEKESLATAHAAPSVKDVYQVHRSLHEGVLNSAAALIANQEAACAGNYIKLSADPRGRTYTLAVPATGHSRNYETARR